MTLWDFLSQLVAFFPSLVGGILLAGAEGVLIHGFNRHGMNFIKYGLKQTSIDETLDKRLNEFHASISESFDKRLNGFQTLPAPAEKCQTPSAFTAKRL